MFSLQQIAPAHAKLVSRKDFTDYIQEIKALGIMKFQALVEDSTGIYRDMNTYHIESTAL